MISNKERFELYKSKYEIELLRRDTLSNQLTLPLTMVGLLFAVFNYCITKLDTLDTPESIILRILLIALFINLGFLVYFIIKSNYNYLYSYTPDSEETEKYYKNLVKYYSDQKIVKEKFEEFLIEAYYIADKKNTRNNDIRSGAFHNARTTFLIGLFISVLLVSTCNTEIIESFFKGGNINVQQSTTTPTTSNTTTATP